MENNSENIYLMVGSHFMYNHSVSTFPITRERGERERASKERKERERGEREWVLECMWERVWVSVKGGERENDAKKA